MSMRKPKTKVIQGVTIAPPKPRKSSKNRTSFSKTNPSPAAYVKGQSGNPDGRFPGIGEHLFSKNAPLILGARAPGDICKAYGMPAHSSVSQCILQRAAIDAMRSSDPAVRASAREFLLRVTEGSRLNVDLRNFADPNAPAQIFELRMADSDGDGRPSEEALAKWPDMLNPPAHLRLPAPSSQE